MTALHHQEPLFSANSVFKSHSLETLPLLGDSACHKFVLKYFFFQPGDSVLEMSPSGADMLKERVLLYLQASARSLKQKKEFRMIDLSKTPFNGLLWFCTGFSAFCNFLVRLVKKTSCMTPSKSSNKSSVSRKQRCMDTNILQEEGSAPSYGCNPVERPLISKSSSVTL